MKAVKLMLLSLMFLFARPAHTQELQLYYDFRHSVDPERNKQNFPLLVFKYFKELDSSGTGSFLLEAQTFLNGPRAFIGQTFLQVSQSLRFWKPKLYLQLNFSGGLGVADPSYGYYIANAYAIGVSKPLLRTRSWYSFSLMYRYSYEDGARHNVQSNIYIGGGLFNYRFMYASSIVAWTMDRHRGNGKLVAFFADPQIWYAVGKGFSVGTRISLNYHVLTHENEIQAYPAIGVKKSF